MKIRVVDLFRFVVVGMCTPMSFEIGLGIGIIRPCKLLCYNILMSYCQISKYNMYFCIYKKKSSPMRIIGVRLNMNLGVRKAASNMHTDGLRSGCVNL